MENERENTRDQNEGSGQQQPLDQQNDNSQQFGRQDQQPEGQQQGQQPLGKQGDFATQEPGLSDQEKGEASQEQGETSTLSEEKQSEPGTSQPTGESGFVGSQGQDSGEYLQQGGNPETGFAEQGQGASDQGDIERDRERSENRDSDIEGSSGKN